MASDGQDAAMGALAQRIRERRAGALNSEAAEVLKQAQSVGPQGDMKITRDVTNALWDALEEVARELDASRPPS